MENNNESFSYTYSASQQDEVKRICQKYLPPEENKMEQLRRLDQSATRNGKLIALIVGVLGSLTLGVGMCCTMVWTGYFVLGIVVGLVGIAGIAAAFPLYSIVTRKQRERLAPQIIKLSQELMGGETRVTMP